MSPRWTSALAIRMASFPFTRVNRGPTPIAASAMVTAVNITADAITRRPVNFAFERAITIHGCIGGCSSQRAAVLIKPGAPFRALWVVLDAAFDIEDHRRPRDGLVRRPGWDRVVVRVSGFRECNPGAAHLFRERETLGRVSRERRRMQRLEHERDLQRMSRSEPAVEDRAFPGEEIYEDRRRMLGGLAVGNGQRGDAHRVVGGDRENQIARGIAGTRALVALEDRLASLADEHSHSLPRLR